MVLRITFEDHEGALKPRLTGDNTPFGVQDTEVRRPQPVTESARAHNYYLRKAILFCQQLQ